MRICCGIAIESQIFRPGGRALGPGFGFASNIPLRVNDRALSKRERGRSRFPHREPIGLHPRAPVDRAPLEKEENDPAASPYLKTTDYARNPRTSRAAPRAGVFAERPSNPELTAEHRPADSEVGSMRCCREIASDRCPAVVIAGQDDRHPGLDEFRGVLG